MFLYQLVISAKTMKKISDSYRVTMRVKGYTPYEGLNLANQKGRKLGVFGRKLEGSHSPVYWYFNKH